MALRRAWAALALLLPLAACSGEAPPAGRAAGAPASDADRPPNVLVVTIDTLRDDHLSGAGYGRPTSPELDRFAGRGVRFTRAFSAGSCTAPSHASIFTGVYPSFHSVGGFNSRYPLLADEVTLAERLAAAGYDTAAVVSNPVLARRLGLDQGFAVYDDRLEGRERNRDRPEQDAAAAVEKARRYLAGLDEPWFLWLHLQDPHGPYEPPPDAPRLGVPEAEAAAAGPVLPVGDDQSGHEAIPQYQALGDERRAGVYQHRYDREIATADRELGRWLAELAAAGELDDTLVAITADHGEALGEDGFWFAHGHSVGLDQVRVPLVLTGPGLPAGGEIATPVTNAALFATVLEAVGLEGGGRGAPGGETAAAGAPDRAAPAGTAPGAPVPSLLALARGEADAAAAAPPVFVESLNQLGIARGDLFLRRDRVPATDEAFWSGPNPTTGGFWKPLGRELSPLAGPADPASVPEHEAVALDDLLDRFQRRADAAAARHLAARDPEVLEGEELRRLRALGYN